VVLREDAMKKLLLVLVVLTIGLIGFELGAQRAPEPLAAVPVQAPAPKIVDPFDPPAGFVLEAQPATTVVDTTQIDRINAARDARAQRLLDAQATADAVVAAQRRQDSIDSD
jgi:hypothetical protein